MLKSLRHLRLSLAAKCELLFGSALALVILAAVFLPWLRMEQLTGQLNERTAEAVINNALNQHVVYWKHQANSSDRRLDYTPGDGAMARPVTQPATAATTAPTTAPTQLQYGPARLLLLRRLESEGTALERRAVEQFRRHPSEDRYMKLTHDADATYSFRYARLLYADSRCAECHSSDRASDDDRPVPEGAFAVASLEIPSQIEPNELLLNRMFIFVAALLAGTIAIAFFYLIISRLILQPVRVLQETAEKVSEGDLNIRTHIPSGDEFQVLSETFNKMLENLKRGEDQLRAINKSLDLKLEEMAESNLALYESNRLKSEFLANVSHELRTPLNSILGFAELLRESAKDPKGSRYVQNITSSGRSLLELINDLLDLAKIEAGRMEVRTSQLSLGDLFEGLSSILRPLLEPRQLAIDVQVATDVPLITTDVAKLQQILYNFLSNAIKFSPNAARIELTAQRRDDRVRISVTDHGPGIPADKQQLIFEKFRQVDASHTRQYGGTGLGLAISRDLSKLLEGAIGIDSEEGHGATFWIELPIRIESSSHDVRENGKETMSNE